MRNTVVRCKPTARLSVVRLSLPLLLRESASSTRSPLSRVLSIGWASSRAGATPF